MWLMACMPVLHPESHYWLRNSKWQYFAAGGPKLASSEMMLDDPKPTANVRELRRHPLHSPICLRRAIYLLSHLTHIQVIRCTEGAVINQPPQSHAR